MRKDYVDKINAELDDLLERDYIEEVNCPSEWISNIVVVPKKNGSIRLCLDARPVNVAIRRQKYPIPPLEAIVDDLVGARYFSKIDLKNAYCQILLDDKSRALTTFISERGLLRHKRMIYGLTSASEDFQRIIEQSYGDLPGVKNISDDTIIFSKTQEEHIHRLKALFERTRQLGLKFNLEKCTFLTQEISFFGLIVGKDGVKMDPAKVEAVKTARAPENANDLKSFLGLATLCNRFIRNFSSLTGPLRKLLKQNVVFRWETQHEKAFNELKTALSTQTCLTYFDPEKMCKLVTDASDYGVGAVLHQSDEGCSKTIAFASRSLTDLERKYTTTEKECLALIFGIQKFHIYLYGKAFEAYVDHKPLESLHNYNKKTNARIERWLMFLQSYDFKIIHLPGSQNIADCLSRLTATNSTNTMNSDEYVNFVISSSVPHSMSLEQVRLESENDPTLAAVRKGLQTNNWEDELVKSYKKIHETLTEKDGIVKTKSDSFTTFTAKTCS